MKLKVCGINDADFAVRAATAGVDYLGFIFHPSSPRCVTVEAARAIVEAVRKAVPATAAPRCVGVFVKQGVREILDILRTARLDVVQLHRRATAEDVAALRAVGCEVWTLAGGAPGDGVLFDSSHGDGETDFRTGDYRAILAGRIGTENLSAALALGPDVLDVNSSLETAPGVKSAARLRAFLAVLAGARHRQANPDRRILDVVAALVRDETGRVLVGQRPAGKAQGGLWEFVGGKIEPGETPEAALARECREELALEIESPAIVDAVVHDYPDKTVNLILLSCTPKPGSRPSALEHQDVRWVAPGELTALDLAPADRELVARLFRPSRIAVRPLAFPPAK